jgi:hypothetical protein
MKDVKDGSNKSWILFGARRKHDANGGTEPSLAKENPKNMPLIPTNMCKPLGKSVYLETIDLKHKRCRPCNLAEEPTNKREIESKGIYWTGKN